MPLVDPNHLKRPAPRVETKAFIVAKFKPCGLPVYYEMVKGGGGGSTAAATSGGIAAANLRSRVVTSVHP